MRSVKHWCKQILRGLVYLHSRDPPVIHRDLKCDNIFINGNQGQVKIGDLGLAAILKKPYADHCVGTPEFMAPEVNEEEYNELVDIYSFGMCVLEMVTFEYPYSECTHPAQIYKKVISGKKPDALYRVRDHKVREFLEKCLATASRRLSAKELLRDLFLKIDECGSEMGISEYCCDFREVSPVLRCTPLYSSLGSWSAHLSFDHEYELHPDVNDFETRGLDPHGQEEWYHTPNVDITIKGKRKADDEIFLRLRIADEEGRVRNIYFPFHVETDTALSVATEMVTELDMTYQDVEKIADLIDGKIAALVLGWEMKPGVGEIPRDEMPKACCNCTSNSLLLDCISSFNSAAERLQVLHCPNQRCAATHGRFEEITNQVKASEPTGHSKDFPNAPSHLYYTDIWAQCNIQELNPSECKDIQCDASNEGVQIICTDVESDISTDNEPPARVGEDYENESRQELR
ncbi:hypothetical protein MLD38_027334 [Melastoma candidum]|uniref:Uncharacterized protein n=1 Tax=Melastoma candidum TaxID=119954 RepID=A0ACB9P198_9MYRT|nr:hypothetical protein MLD38_027334 [Melastoma candidum]